MQAREGPKMRPNQKGGSEELDFILVKESLCYTCVCISATSTKQLE